MALLCSNRSTTIFSRHAVPTFLLNVNACLYANTFSKILHTKHIYYNKCMYKFILQQHYVTGKSVFRCSFHILHIIHMFVRINGSMCVLYYCAYTRKFPIYTETLKHFMSNFFCFFIYKIEEIFITSDILNVLYMNNDNEI